MADEIVRLMKAEAVVNLRWMAFGKVWLDSDSYDCEYEYRDAQVRRLWRHGD